MPTQVAPADGLIYAVLRRATVGLVVAGGIVTDAPPYLRRVRGADARQVWRELARQATRLEWLPDTPDTPHPPRPGVSSTT